MNPAGRNNPCGEKSKIEMNPSGRNNPWRGISSNQDTFPTPKGIQRYPCQAIASNLLKFITAVNS